MFEAIDCHLTKCRRIIFRSLFYKSVWCLAIIPIFFRFAMHDPGFKGWNPSHVINLLFLVVVFPLKLCKINENNCYLSSVPIISFFLHFFPWIDRTKKKIILTNKRKRVFVETLCKSHLHEYFLNMYNGSWQYMYQV